MKTHQQSTTPHCSSAEFLSGRGRAGIYGEPAEAAARPEVGRSASHVVTGHARGKPPWKAPLVVGRLYVLDLRLCVPNPQLGTLGARGAFGQTRPQIQIQCLQEEPTVSLVLLEPRLCAQPSTWAGQISRPSQRSDEVPAGRRGSWSPWAPHPQPAHQPRAPPAALRQPPLPSEGKDSLEFVGSLQELPFRTAGS